MQEVSNRKKLIRPVTILKVRQYLKAISDKIISGEVCSLDQLAREHSISGSNATAMVRLGLIKETDVKHKYEFADIFAIDDMTAKMIIEDVRKHNLKKSPAYEVHGKSEISISLNGNRPSLNDPGKDDPMVSQLNEGLKSKQIGSMLERALNQVVQSKQTTIFDSQISDHRDLVQIASAISSGVYSGVTISMSETLIEEQNDRILFAAKNLLKKLKS